MKLQFSAGGVVYKHERTRNQTSSLKTTKDIIVLVSQHSQHHGWVFPKGLIEDHPSTSSGQVRKETKENTALREVKEETGVEAKILKPLSPVAYWFKLESDTIKKTVYYFLMEYTGGDITKHDHEMENVEFLPIDKVEERLTYKSDKKVWEEARKLLVNS